MYFRAADCDSDHYLVVAKVRERLAVNKQKSQIFHMERFNLKKLNEVEGKEQFHVEVSNRFSALEDMDAEVEINSAWETIRENINISAKGSLGYFELKKHKPWFDEKNTKTYDSVRREVLYNILKEFGVSLKLFRLIKVHLNATYKEVYR
jgi:hypothetical protein